ncbi:uncharacterized protein N7459_009575 [Penicillium hispanicum]|uniref:uncharacterized protein n=1 Tax=Penicillium hispanicum TaxID=1080232 RepID=UPI0025404F7B|nr:uncharacterized protein N7459_009575 [Penicillium hispanicum]KAJ5570145.1 hypothetical protein N7459_009575 [Penicillium hispanicum]
MKLARYMHILQYVFLATLLPVASSRTLVQRSESLDQWEEAFQDMLADFGDGQVQLTDAEWSHLMELEKAEIDNEPDSMELDTPDPVMLEIPTTTQVETSTATESLPTLAPAGQRPLVYGSRTFEEENPIRLNFLMPSEDCDAIFVVSTYGTWFLVYGTEYGQDVTNIAEEEIQRFNEQQQTDTLGSKPGRMRFFSTQAYKSYIQPAIRDTSTGYRAFINQMRDINKEKAGTAQIVGVVSVAKTYPSTRISQSRAAENHKLINAIKYSAKVAARNQYNPHVPVLVPAQDEQIRYYNRDHGSEISIMLARDETRFYGELSFGWELRKISVGGDDDC